MKDIYIRILPSQSNYVVNGIQGHDGCCYPDILYRHRLAEQFIESEELYAEAINAQQECGTSRCMFIAVAQWDDDVETAVTNFIHSCSFSNPPLNDTEHSCYERLSNGLMLSQTMRSSFMQLLIYYKACQGSIEGLITPFFEEYALPVTTKNEGKVIYELIRNTILG